MTRLVTPTFDHAKQPIFGQHLIFVNLHQYARNQSIPSVHSSDTVNFRVLSPHWPHPFLTMPTPKTFNHLLVCISLYLHANNHLAQSAHSRDTVNFRVLRPYWTHAFLSMPNQNIFNQLLIFVHLYQHAKNMFILQIQSILESCHQTGLNTFLTMSTPKYFSHLFISMNLYQHVKSRLIPLLHSWDAVSFRVQRPDWPNPFSSRPTKTFGFWLFNRFILEN